MRNLCICLCILSVCLCGCATVGTSSFPAGVIDPTEPDTAVMPTAQTAEEPLPPEPEESRVSFLAAGDAIAHEGIYLEARKNARVLDNGRDYDFSHLFACIGETVASYDIAFVNQETLMAGAEYGYSAYPRFNTPRELADDLVGVGFDVVNIANNHMMDMMAEGLASTIAFWKTKPVTLIGGYENAQDYDAVRVVEKNGIKIAFLSYCYGTNGLSMPSNYDMIIPYLDEEVIRRQTAAANEQADFVVVSVHWGEDSVQAVTNDQKQYAQLFADCGVDVIVGHHPHLIQPIEWIDGKDGNRTLCAYSLGNLFSLMADAYNMVGGFLTLDFVKVGDNCTLENATFRPTVFHYATTFYSQCIYPMEDYTEALAAKHGVQNYGTSHLASYADLVSYTKQLIAAEFLSEAFR